MAVLQRLLAAIDAKADHFSLLQLPRNAEPLQIRNAYFRLAKVVHPDHPLFANNPQLRAQATRAFQAITSANSTLGDPLKRSGYVHSMAQAAMERSDAVAAQMQAGVRATVPTSPTYRATGPQPHAVDIVPVPGSVSNQRTPRGVPTSQSPTAPGAMSRPMVASSLSGTGQFSRTTLTGPQQPVQVNSGATGQFQRPPGQGPQSNSGTGQFQRTTGSTPMGGTGQFSAVNPAPGQRPTPSGQSSMGPTTAPSAQPQYTTSTRGLEPPPNAEVAKIYLHSGRQQLNRRDWVGAQEALERALPLLEKNEAADCKVMLAWAIFNNNSNAEVDRIERPKAMWNEVATQYAKTPFHAQAAYYLAIWHKLHGELRHVMNNLNVCLDLQPNHIEAAREKRLMEQRRSNLAEMQELEARERAVKARRASKTSIPTGRPTPAAGTLQTKKVALPKEQSWLEKLFGGEKK